MGQGEQLSPSEKRLWRRSWGILNRRQFLRLLTSCGATAVLVALDNPKPFINHSGSMIVDIGSGTTKVAVFSLGGIVISRSIRMAGEDMDKDIIQYMQSKYSLLIGKSTAERAKIEIGSAYSLIEERTMTLRGRNLISGLPEAREVSSIELREALSSSVKIIVDTIRAALDDTPPELVADLMEVGICITGGGGQLKGMTERIAHDLNIRTWLSEVHMTHVAHGASHIR